MLFGGSSDTCHSRDDPEVMRCHGIYNVLGDLVVLAGSDCSIGAGELTLP